MNDSMLLEVRDLVRVYRQGGNAVHALDGLTLDLPRGATLAVTGRSGSGKSTLLHVLAGLDAADAGEVTWYLGGSRWGLTRMSEDARTRLRRAHMGFVFQFFNLVPTLSALENVQLMAELNGLRNAQQRARDELEAVGLGARLQAFPATLSGGEQQRVAIARALVHGPGVVLADEPTGNLDAQTADAVFAHLQTRIAETGAALVLVTHDGRLAQRMDGRLDLEQS